MGVAVLFCASTSAFAEDQDALAEQTAPFAPAWEQAASYLFNDANRAFREAKDNPAVDERERQFGEAVTLLNIQPRKQENIARARTMLEALAGGQPPDALGNLARFFAARICEVHQDPPDREKAAALYRQVLEARSGNPVVELAAARLVLIEAAAAGNRDERLQRLAGMEPLAALLITPQGRREFHTRLGSAYLAEGDLAPGIAHLVRADKEGFTWPQAEGNTWLAIAEAARLKGDAPLAAAYYRKFLGKYQRDVRCYTAAQRLKEIQGLGAPQG
jgi:tetratricopeptide (TPR) repeat protein